MSGEVAVWILIRSGHDQKDRRALGSLKTHLDRASASLRIPETGVDVNGSPVDVTEPILVAVREGHAVVGPELAESLGLKAGDRITLRRRTFTVSQCNEERGSRDDISIWIDLSEAQTILGRPGRINAILALKCPCTGNELANVRRDVASVLPGAQVIEQGSKVLTRAEARDRAAQEATEALAAEVANRLHLRDEQEKFSSILVPLVLLASAPWVGLVFYTNVRERRSEIGILRALGSRARTILRLFLTRALLMGLAGGLAGYVLGTSIGLAGTGKSGFHFWIRAVPSGFLHGRRSVAGRQLGAGVLRGAAGTGGRLEGRVTAMLVLERVAKTYPKGNRLITALAPIDLTVRAGQFVAVQGPSGSGKITCLLIAGRNEETDRPRLRSTGVPGTSSAPRATTIWGLRASFRNGLFRHRIDRLSTRSYR